MPPLSQLEVLVVDCQATAAAPRGHLLELGWARLGPEGFQPHASLIRLPHGERIPPAVARITGISERMSRTAVEGQAVWRELSAEAARVGQQPAPAIAHFARFEAPFLNALAGGARPFDLVCTHEIARRLLPDLPRCSLRAVTGYFGRAVGTLRRSAEHVEATGFVWRELVPLLDDQGISTWAALCEWLESPERRPRVAPGRRRRVWPMPRELRLSLPDAPGVYRMLRTSGDVLYVGKASSLNHRVNSYFRKQHGMHERTLEMLSQARGVSFEITPSALEAALLECDEIKRHRPPYNVALTESERDVWFAPRDLRERSRRSSARCAVGPFPSAQTLDQFVALARGRPEALGDRRWGPDRQTFDEGYARFMSAHPRELTGGSLAAHARLLRLGARLWREGRRDSDLLSDDSSGGDTRRSTWTAEHVQLMLERIALRAVLARRRARWLTRLADASLVWTEPGAPAARLIVIENADIALRASADAGAEPPVPSGWRRPTATRHEALTIARFDRLRVLTTELKRLVSEGAHASLRFGERPPLSGERLARALARV